MNDIGASFVAVESAATPDGIAPRARISVIMVVYMTGEALEQSLACVLADPEVDEFVLVDNGSNAREAAAMRAVAAGDRRLREAGVPAVVSLHDLLAAAQGALPAPATGGCAWSRATAMWASPAAPTSVRSRPRVMC